MGRGGKKLQERVLRGNSTRDFSRTPRNVHARLHLVLVSATLRLRSAPRRRKPGNQRTITLLCRAEWYGIQVQRYSSWQGPPGCKDRDREGFVEARGNLLPGGAPCCREDFAQGS